MNPLRRLGLWLAGERKSITTAETLPKWQLGRPYRPPTPVISNQQALKGMRAAGVVYACIRLIADAATSVPLNLYRSVTGDDGKPDWEHAENHPLQLLLNKPNSKLTRRRLYYRAIQHLMLNGNAIWAKIRVPKSGPPVQLWPLNPDDVKPIPDAEDYVSGYEVNLAGRREFVAARDIVHLQLENPETPYWGLGPLQAAMLDIELYAGNKRWNLRTVERGAVVPGVLEIPEDLSLEQYTQLREQVDARSFGEDDAGRELILGSGMKYHRMSLTGEEIGFLESMRFGREEIAMIFGVPPAMLTPDNATLANVEAYNKQFWETLVVPLTRGVEDILTQALVPDFTRAPNELQIEHDYSQVPAMQDSLDDQSQVAERLVRTGFTVEGVNRLLDLGFEEDEIKPPAPVPAAFGGPTDEGDEAEVDEEQEQEEKRLLPTRTKRLTHQQLATLAQASDTERRAWEDEIAARVLTTMRAEGEDVVKAWLDTERGSAAILASRRHHAAWEALLTATYVEAARHFARREYDRLNPTKATKAFDPLQIAVEWARTEAAKKVVNISAATEAGIRDTIREGLTVDPKTGLRLTTDQIASLLRERFGITDHLEHIFGERHYRIARTELGFAMNYGHDQAARSLSAELDLPMLKVWSTALDARVRDSHAAMHGETVGMDEAFSNGLMYPGDPSAWDPAEVVNCRCVLVHEIAR